jgi:hypothetical protein
MMGMELLRRVVSGASFDPSICCAVIGQMK